MRPSGAGGLALGSRWFMFIAPLPAAWPLQPMNCEEMLVEQVQRTTEASPGTTVWVYRNAIKVRLTFAL